MTTIITRALTSILLLLTMSACAQSPANNGDIVTAQAKIQPPDLINTRWQLVKIQSMDDSEYLPDDPAKYQIAFMAEGRLGVVADCNRGSGQWTRNGPNQLVFSRIALTRAACGPDSLSDRFVSNLEYVRSFVYANGHIFLATMADGAILEFEPVADQVARPSFDCSNAEGSVEQLICRTVALPT